VPSSPAAQSLIDDWKEKNPAHVGKEDMFEGPNTPKKKRRDHAGWPGAGSRRDRVRQLLDRLRRGH